MLNRCIVMGRLVKDPELRHTNSGTSVATFALACDRDFKSKNGEKETDWLDIVAWRNTADFVGSYFTKGRAVVVEGRLQTRTYEDKQGNKRKAVEIVADNVYFADSKKDGGKSDSAEADPLDQFAEIDDDTDDLPF